MKQTIYETVSNKRSIPFNVAGTGTLLTRGIAIVGTDTLFTTEMKAGSYLVNLTTNEAIKVYRVDSDTVAFLEKPFAAEMTFETPQIIPWYKAKMKKVKLVTSSNNFINGNAYTGTFEVDKLGDDRSGRPDLIDPFILDSTTGATVVEIQNY